MGKRVDSGARLPGRKVGLSHVPAVWLRKSLPLSEPSSNHRKTWQLLASCFIWNTEVSEAWVTPQLWHILICCKGPSFAVFIHLVPFLSISHSRLSQRSHSDVFIALLFICLWSCKMFGHLCVILMCIMVFTKWRCVLHLLLAVFSITATFDELHSYNNICS